jgi:prepilin-type N-terminal cleavage/methylation domain-containing protein
MAKFFRSSKGFSLIELMIVVAIIAILAAIAIPSFLRFQMKSKTAEATANLGAIRTCEESYRAENDEYTDQGPAPIGGGTDATPDPWTPADLTSFQDIGFAPDGPTRYLYEVGPGSTSTVFVATATGDLDEDTLPCIFTVDKLAADYPKAVKTGDDF